jgi:PBP1b-binding outer membrane lipoprotein LpoB
MVQAQEAQQETKKKQQTGLVEDWRMTLKQVKIGGNGNMSNGETKIRKIR